ncbi:esterase B1-like [Culicoides brevitarsis]|uniref:esterase B1-like n=1 Tax=Culicoides brevitarsis TaxID=469753 RepID=UPI00307B7400
MSVITTNSGPIRGVLKTTDTEKEYFAFFNVPFSKKFNKESIFKDPEPIEPWTEILDVTQEGESPFNIDPFRENPCEGSLETLGMNIFVPKVDTKSLFPVFVHIHGGAFINGSNSTFLYGPDYLIENEIIMISINYRVNIFGFLSFKDPTLGIPGNAGLKDQNLALKWIKENIHHFGGDSSNITLCGESAGAASVEFHMISPMSEGLFNRAIMMSGSAFSPWASVPEDFDKYMDRLVMKLGLNESSSEEMIFKKICETNPEELLKLTLDIVDFEDKFFGPILLSPFLPRVERYNNGNCFLPESIKDLAENAWSKDINLIIGAGSMEGVFYYVCNPSDENLAKVDQDPSLLLPLELQLNLSEELKREKGRIMKKLYFEDKSITKDMEKEYNMYMADKLTNYPIFQTISYRQPRCGNKTFLYRLNLPPSTDVPAYYQSARALFNIPNNPGTAHGEDIPLLYKTKIARRFHSGDDLYLQWQKFLTAFVNFVKIGQPNMENWHPITDKTQHFEINISENWKMEPLVNLSKLHEWSRLYERD